MRLGGVLVVGVLAGCQPAPAANTPVPSATLRVVPQDVAPAPPVSPPDSAPSVDGHKWSHIGGTLMYVPVPSDDIHIQMECAERGKLNVRAYNPIGKGEKLHLMSGKESETFPAKGIPGDGELLALDDYSSEITVSTANGVMSAFRAAGQRPRETPGHPLDVMNAKTPEELTTIEQFFAGCDGESSKSPKPAYLLRRTSSLS